MIEMKMNQPHPSCRHKEKEQLYKIGMFANMNRVTIKALRYYDEQKLLVISKPQVYININVRQVVI